MGLKFRGLIGAKSIGSDVPVVQEKQQDAEGTPGGVVDKELDPTLRAAGTTASSGSSNDEKKDLQFGVQVAEATLQVWTKEHLILAYLL